eukprot:78156-Rhodomonas_salina.1
MSGPDPCPVLTNVRQTSHMLRACTAMSDTDQAHATDALAIQCLRLTHPLAPCPGSRAARSLSRPLLFPLHP